MSVASAETRTITSSQYLSQQPQDYAERVYAGVLGKIIGVYLGRPFEGWLHERILEELGEVDRYVHERFGVPLVVTDDDISGTFTFLRALEDQGIDPDLTPQQIGEAWLNYTIERRTIFWWGGLGNSTEHTAYLRLKAGVPAPESGSIARNTKVVAEQIGSQIFIDGWAMINPGDPERAADFARRAASVSHDGEAIYGAQVVAAIEAAAFVEPDIQKLLDIAVSVIPADSTIARLIGDLREWHAKEPDWYKTRALIQQHYNYELFPGNCHMVPNHAIIIHALLHGEGDFRRSLMIANTDGWDTDCNSGNVGCILGIRGGLATFTDVPDLRGPVADRLYLPTAEGGRAISDAAIESVRVINLGRGLQGLEPVAPKGGSRFHFEFPGAVQGFAVDPSDTATIENVPGHSAQGERSLAIRLSESGPVTVTTPTFIPDDTAKMRGYQLYASPTLHSGQTVRARIEAEAGNDGPVMVRLLLRTYGAGDRLETHDGPAVELAPGGAEELTWRAPDCTGDPIAAIGLRVTGAASDAVYLDYVGWDGEPEVTLGRPPHDGTYWRRAWVDAVDQWDAWWKDDYRVVQNHGTGLIMQGGEEWRDITVGAPLTVHLAASAGLAVRVGGLRRYYAFVLAEGGTVRIVKAKDGLSTLAEAAYAWEPQRRYDLSLTVERSLTNDEGHVMNDTLNRALIAAAWRNDVAEASRLIAQGADVNAKDETVQSAYLIATSEGYLDLLLLTIENGADIEAKDSYNGTGLIRAADRGHAQVIATLLRAGIAVDHINNLGWTALHEAIILGDGGQRYVDSVRLLLAGGADPTLPSQRDGLSPLMHAESRGFGTIAKTIRAVIQSDPPRDGTDALLAAGKAGDADRVVIALRAGADPESLDSDGRTILAISSEAGSQDIVRILHALTGER